MLDLHPIDFAAFGLYFIIVISIALWASRKPKGHERNADDYFLAGRSLPWWIIGSSVIAANISTEQIIGMTGTAFASGIAVVSYEWLSALILLVVAKYFLPVFLKEQIFSLPEFLRKRYSGAVSSTLGFFWVIVYVFVNLTSVLYLGALTLETVAGLPLAWGITGLAALCLIYIVYGGLAAVAWTDFIQVAALFLGGILVTWLGLNAVSDGSGTWAGFQILMQEAPDRFHTVLPANHETLPWTGIFLGGLWIAALSYFGCNQYIIQRALAAKSIAEAQKGLLFAAFLKIVVPIIVVLPGVIAFVLFREGSMVERPDQAYPVLVRELVPVGFVGIIIAALTAAIVSSLNSMTNSAATIFTMDIYRRYFRKNAGDRELVRVGRGSTVLFLATAGCIAPALANFTEVFQFIQEYTGFVSPGVLALFLFGIFARRVTPGAAFAAVLLTIPFSVGMKLGFPDMAFLNRMAFTFIGLCLVMALWPRGKETDTTPTFASDLFKTTTAFNVGSLGVVLVLGALYAWFW